MKDMVRLVVFLVIITSSSVFAQSDTAGWGKNSNYNRMYDPKTVTEINGEIISIEQVVPLKGMSSGIHLLVNTGNETISVHLGPSWYINEQEIRFKVKDKIIVKGSKISLEGEPVIIAKEISKDGKMLVLRNESGVPAWAGKGRK